MVEGKPLVDLIRPSGPLGYRKPIHIAIGLWVDLSKKKVLHFRAMSRSIDLAWIPMDISYPNKKFTPTLVLTAFRMCISLGIYLTYKYNATILKYAPNQLDNFAQL